MPLTDQLTEVLHHALWNAPAADQQSHLHVQAESKVRQVGAGEQEEIGVGHSALCMKRAVSAGCIDRSLSSWPCIHRGMRSDFPAQRLHSIECHLTRTLFRRLGNKGQG